MRLVSWNCCKGPLAKKLAVLEELAADVALVSECPDPRGAEGWSCAWHGERAHQGVAVLARAPYAAEPLPVDPRAARFAVPARVSGPVSFAALTVWRQQEGRYVEGLQSVVAAYDGLLRDGDAVLAGDLNSNASFDAAHPRYCHSDFVADMEARGLASGYHAFFGEPQGGETRPTHHWTWRVDKPFHLDYCFVPARWLGALTEVRIAPLDRAARISDHLPIVVDVAEHRLPAVTAT